MSVGDEPVSYKIRISERARRDLDAITLHFRDVASTEIAISWREGFYQTLAGTALFPRRCPLVPEKFQSEVRHFLYRRADSNATYRVLFTIRGEGAGAPDGPTVLVMHVRHASARPITRAEAPEIEAQARNGINEE